VVEAYRTRIVEAAAMAAVAPLQLPA